MSDQPGNRIPTAPKSNFQSSNPKDVAATENGNAPWVSKPNPEESYNVELSEHFKPQGNLPKRKSLSAELGTIETAKGQDQ